MTDQPKRGPGRPKGSKSAPPSQNVTVRIEALLVRKLDAITSNRSKWFAERIKRAKPNEIALAPGANEKPMPAKEQP